MYLFIAINFYFFISTRFGNSELNVVMLYATRISTNSVVPVNERQEV